MAIRSLDHIEEVSNLSLTDIFHIHLQRIHDLALAADDSPGKLKANRIQNIILEEATTMSCFRSEGRDVDFRQNYIDNSSKQRELKELLIELGIAEMMVQGDYRVNRTHEIPSEMGVIDLPKIEAALIRFQAEHDLMDSSSIPSRESRYIHLDLGCGNMGSGFQRRRSKENPFGVDGNTMTNYIEQIGYANRIYFTLEDSLKKCVLPKHKDNQALQEVLTTILLILNRKMYFARKFNKKPTRETETLIQMIGNVNLLPEVLQNITKYIPNLAHLKTVGYDKEFLHDDRKPLSREAKRLLKKFAKKTQEFLDEYFDLTNNSLNGSIVIHPHNVVLGDFSEFGEIFPEKDSFLMASSFRAISHAEDFDYKNTVVSVAKRLLPGGLFLEDGRRESYTRFDRIALLKTLSLELGPEYRVKIIQGQDESLKTTVIERGVLLADGSYEFFTDTNNILRDNQETTVDLEKALDTHQVYLIKNLVIQKVRNLFIDGVFENKSRDDYRSRIVFSQRLEFVHLHPEIERIMRHVNYATDANPESIAAEIYEKLQRESEKIKTQVRAFVDGAVPLRKKAYPLIIPSQSKYVESGVNEPETIDIEGIPRNSLVPTIQTSELLRSLQVQLIEKCKRIKQITGAAPIQLVEYDALTSPMMRRTLEKVLQDKDLFEINDGTPEDIQNDAIYLIGGNFTHTVDDHNNIIDKFAYPLLERIKNGSNIAVFGVGFGSQIALEAYGKAHNVQIETQEGALEFGPTPVIFDPSVPLIGSDKLSAGCSVVMTHSRYSVIPDIENSGLKPLAKYTKVFSPPACEGEKGRLITCQFHPEVELSSDDDRKILSEHLQRYSKKILRQFDVPNLKGRSVYGRSTSPHTLANHNINIIAVNKRGEKEPWISRDICMAFMIPQLLKQVEIILENLNSTAS
ncbi:hypothetical protein COU74_01270 [Candidatus Peregrinibacteria bacterium CG10_big_fil_rev_8_21_14_0_10_36_19]|nr:MAG: hypothetical protein COU74_01270 [Candidatus Peregrinibacteria bacterium CG10_big_fil_rev_8_21_14_0_10_36_19]